MKKRILQLRQFVTGFIGRITVKIWLSSAAVGLVAIMLVFLMSQIFFNSYFLALSLSRNQQATLSALESSDASMDYVVNRLISICARTADFRLMLRRIRHNTDGTDKQLNNDLQEHLNELSTCHPLVEAALIVSPDNTVYYPVARSLDTNRVSFTMGYPKSSFQRITFLPVLRSPFTADGQSMPLAVPMTFSSGESMLYIADTAAAADAMLYLFLDVDSLNATLDLYNNSGVNLLLSPEGRVLNYESDSPQALLAQECGLAQAIDAWDGQEQTIRLGNWYALPYRVSQHSLYLVHMVSYNELIAPQREIGHALMMVALSAIVIITLAALFTAVYLAKPMNQVNRAVKAIETGEYTASMVLPQKDEIGELSASVDSMYRTIQAQMDQIRHERQAKDHMEMRLFAEQINPHFLYNTLEHINLEVYNHHTQNASMMIQALGEFLRIGLNFGREQIPLQRELEHVQAYITIMNHRFGQEIGFTTDIPESLLSEPVAKIILQPLVENSIRHGFQMESSDSFIEIPTISIRGALSDNMLILSVIDNGTGFDVENARRIMHEDPSLQKHVGLSNVYHRLKLHYGEEADIELQSIPYYKNTVSIRIPYRNAAERSKV